MPETQLCPNCFAPGYAGRCAVCGYVGFAQRENHMVMPAGSSLCGGRYLLGRVLGAGGFGVTYLAKDEQAGALCAVKEYLPTQLCVRDSGRRTVRPSSGANRDVFLHGLRLFGQEAAVLQKFSGNGAVVQVHGYFEENGTAYFAMEYLDGVNLKALARSMGGRVPPRLAQEVLLAIARTLQDVHSQNLLHRDISPENIFVTQKGAVKLIDFGATRYFVSERSQSLSVILKPGFAPPEQYSSHGKQGPWTDIYALCATFYNAVTGQNVPDAPDRLAGAPLPGLAGQCPGLSPLLCTAIESGLALDWRARPQNVRELLMAVNAPRTKQTASLPDGQVAAVHGNPFVQLWRAGKPKDRWLLPKNMRMSVGRAAEQCNILLDDPGVSRLHCTLQYDDKANVFYLVDFSTNGTAIGTKRLEKNRTAVLQPGDTFRLLGCDYEMKVGLE